MRNLIIICSLIVILTNSTKAQFTDRYWAFGDSAALDFKNLNTPVPSTSILRVRGTCASICDSAGNLIFYAGSPDLKYWLPPSTVRTMGHILNKFNQIIPNGDSLRTTLWYQEMTIVPNPGNKNQFYIFQCGVTTTTNPGFSYSLVDMSMNGGLGYVIQKNVILSTLPHTDACVAVQHGNGRDWWVVAKPWETTIPVNSYYVYLISPTGVSAPIIQSIGTTSINSGLSRMKFTKSGTKLYIASQNNMIESYDFDRCTGLLSNFININPVYITGPGYFFDGMEISPDESKMYISSIYGGTNQDTAIIVQIDLSVPNSFSTLDTLATIIKPNHIGPIPGNIQLGPDDKIYFATNYDIGDCGFSYLYCDTSSYFTENMNLSVINQPNNLGAACNLQLYSQYLGGHRSYWGLPNNPNYELGRLIGSACDSLTVGHQEIKTQQPDIFVYYEKDWKKAFINAKDLQGKNYVLNVIDMNGKIIYSQQGQPMGSYFTKDLAMESFSDGVYLIILQTEKEKLVKKMVKE
jgi:hypothetical protein